MDDVVWQLDEMETERRDPPPVSPAPGILLKKVPPVLEIAEDEKKLAPPPVHDPVQVPPLIMREPLPQEPPVQESSLVERPLEGPVVKPPAEAPAKELPPVQEEPLLVTGQGEKEPQGMLPVQPPVQEPAPAQEPVHEPPPVGPQVEQPAEEPVRPPPAQETPPAEQPVQEPPPIEPQVQEPEQEPSPTEPQVQEPEHAPPAHVAPPAPTPERHALLRRPHLMSHETTNQAAMNLEGGGRARAAGSRCT
jgi:hypothetical protein